jgi:hypothetical protein
VAAQAETSLEQTVSQLLERLDANGSRRVWREDVWGDAGLVTFVLNQTDTLDGLDAGRPLAVVAEGPRRKVSRVATAGAVRPTSSRPARTATRGG